MHTTVMITEILMIVLMVVCAQRRTSRVQARICVLNLIQILPVITLMVDKTAPIQANHRLVFEISVLGENGVVFIDSASGLHTD